MPFNAKGSEWILVCSEAIFTALTGVKGYTIIDMQVDKDISEQVADMIPPKVRLLDKQQGNQEARIALVAFINIS